MSGSEIRFLGIASKFSEQTIIRDEDLKDYRQKIGACISETTKKHKITEAELIKVVIGLNPRDLTFITFPGGLETIIPALDAVVPLSNKEIETVSQIYFKYGKTLEDQAMEKHRLETPRNRLGVYVQVIYAIHPKTGKGFIDLLTNATEASLDSMIKKYGLIGDETGRLFLRLVGMYWLVDKPGMAKIVYDYIGTKRENRDYNLDMEISVFKNIRSEFALRIMNLFFQDNADILDAQPDEVKDLYMSVLASGDAVALAKMVEYNIVGCDYMFVNGESLRDYNIKACNAPAPAKVHAAIRQFAPRTAAKARQFAKR